MHHRRRWHMSIYEQAVIDSEQHATATQELPSIPIRLFTTTRLAIRALMGNKLRTMLTALGVIIGVAAVVALLALGRGAQEEIAESITANGANLLTVLPGSLKAGGFTPQGGKTKSLTMKDV